MALTSSEAKSDLDSGLESDEDEVFLNYLILI